MWCLRALVACITSLSLSINAQEIEWDAAVGLNLAAHIDGAEPDFSEQGGDFILKFTQDTAQYSLTGEGRARWNDAYNSSEYSESARDAYEWSADWRELYIAKDIHDWNISFTTSSLG
jgi:hypothetical protein